MKTDKVVKKLGAGAKNNTKCRSFSYSIRSFPTFFSNYGTKPLFFSVEFVVSLHFAFDQGLVFFLRKTIFSSFLIHSFFTRFLIDLND